ncbi:MAG: hypothetical protein GXP53_01885 [Deltaproteobacteria bacterium]|nr:hypothetical protein [Deltaproteobacteria bacterium]
MYEYYMYASAFATPLRLVYGTFYLAIVTGLPDLRVRQNYENQGGLVSSFSSISGKDEHWLLTAAGSGYISGKIISILGRKAEPYDDIEEFDLQ